MKNEDNFQIKLDYFKKEKQIIRIYNKFDVRIFYKL
jgi:hypothetical protein